MKPVVKIVVEDDPDGYGQDIINVYINGEYLGGGRCGGEPEDNCRTRDWDWVEQLVTDIAKKLGADVSRELEGANHK